MTTRIALSLIVALSALALPSTAAATPRAVIVDCQRDGDVDRRWSARDLERALALLPADIRDYGDCRAAIARQQRIYAPALVGRRIARVRVQCFSTRPARVNLLYHGRSLGNRAFRCRAGRQLRPSVRLSRTGLRLAARRAWRIRLVVAVGRKVEGYPLQFGRASAPR